jgi:hypothetical protein
MSTISTTCSSASPRPPPPVPNGASTSPTTASATGARPKPAIPGNAPPCAQDAIKATQALDNIISAVGEVLSGSGHSGTTVDEIQSMIRQDESISGDVNFIGGHFNLTLEEVQIDSLSAGIRKTLYDIFFSGADGSSSGVLGLFANGPRHDLTDGTSLHSQAVGGGIRFHIDLGNPYRDLLGIGIHLEDVVGGRQRNKCLD